MKTKELIRILQEEDPSGEVECCVGNEDIHFVAIMPAYWDGRLQVLQRDEKLTNCYNIVGAKVTSRGSKIKIYTHSIESAIMAYVEWKGIGARFPVDLSELDNNNMIKDYERAIDKWHEEANEVMQSVEDMSNK